ncbi:MAG: pyridoxal-phosphate dependent enzyme [Polyangiales bacterium]
MTDAPPFGEYPTPVMQMVGAARAAGIPDTVQLWCKRDDLTAPIYGGNKVRKLERLLAEARAKGAKRIVTVGAVGSHHVLATAIYAQREGIPIEAVLAPQPFSRHVEDVVRVGATLAIKPHPVGSFAAIPLRVARCLTGGGHPYFIPPGGSSVTGSLGYVDAAMELAAQIDRGDIPRPDAIVVALGSGGTVAGLLVGLNRAGLLAPTADGRAKGIDLIAVRVVDPPLASGAATLALSLGIRRQLGDRLSRADLASLSRALHVVSGHLGRGYGHETEAGVRATEVAALDSIALDMTYTAKTFAAALDECRTRPKGAVILYWHTLAAPAPFARLVEAACPIEQVDPAVRALMLRPSGTTSPQI